MLEPVRPSRTVLSGKQARRVCASPPGPEVHRCTWSRVGGSPASAWASWHRVASPGPGPCSPPARHDASQERPSGRGADTAYSLACASCQEQNENISTDVLPSAVWGEAGVGLLLPCRRRKAATARPLLPGGRGSLA